MPKKPETPQQFERRIRRQMRDDFEFYAPRALVIRLKKGNVEPFTLNKAQRFLHRKSVQQFAETGMIRMLILKGRQQGISTYVEGRFYWRVTHREGVKAFILTHEEAATQNLFEMVDRYHQHCPVEFKPSTGTSSAKELSFDKLDCGYKVGTAGTKGVGRSSTIQYFHGSEVAFWPHADTHAMGVIQAVPREPNTEVFLESTANGIGNYFHAQWQAAESGLSSYITAFLPWYWQPEYRLPIKDGFQLRAGDDEDEVALLDQFGPDGLTVEHLAWRREKIVELSAKGSGDDGLWRFRQEYPFTAAEAFQTSGDEGLIDPKKVMAARKRDVSRSPTAANVVGVDPARFGNDRTSICFRQGRTIYRLDSYRKKSTMQIVGICGKILQDPVTKQDTDVDMMFIDEGGLGAGVVDRLIELGFEDRITPVNGGDSPIDTDRYMNKRAEMWGELNEWFNLIVDIPDSDTFQADVCGPQYSYDSASRIVLERKESMIKRGLVSPDEGDSAALTLAFPVARNQRHRRPLIQSFSPIDSAVGY